MLMIQWFQAGHTKKSMTKKQIIKEFADCSGKQFDPELCIFFIEKVIENL